ncbi:MAG: endopeptidase La [Longimicrobiales bacterium]
MPDSMTGPVGDNALPARLPLLPLRSTIVYPLGVVGLQIGTPSTIDMLAARTEPNLLVALALAPGGPDDPIDPRSLVKIGVAGRVTDRLNLPGGTLQVTLQGLQRIRIQEAEPTNGYFTARTTPARDIPADTELAEDLIARVLTALEALAHIVDRVPREVPRILRMNVADPSRFADLVATLANFSVQSKDEVLQRLDVEQRLAFELEELEQQLHRIRQVEEAEERERQAEEALPPARRINELRRRIQLMQAELGEVDPVEREIVDLLRRVDAAELPPRQANRARNEIERLRSIAPGSPEASEVRAYVDWILHLPWRARATEGLEAVDLARVEAVFNAELLGLSEPKERLLDYLAVAKLSGELRGPIPCLVGPPGVGKSALATALARGLGRPLARIELGGRGEGGIVGTRRTRAGAQPGKLVTALRDVAVADPLILLEEVDELSGPKSEGDPAEALEEAIEWPDRAGFVDRYIDVEFDLSPVLYIATAQDFYRIPRDLRDHMHEVRIAGYTPEEKVAIARDRLLPRLIEEHGLVAGDVGFTDASLFFLARGYARDAGLGLLRRALSTLLRTRARAKAQGDRSCWEFDHERVESILGLPRHTSTVAESAPEVGVVTGLAWTAAGGDLMFIEALRMPGSGRLLITGMLGDVMRESVNAAYSYVRSRGETLGISEDTFRDSDVHVHFPEGAIPKDGPSAGIAVTLAVASSLSARPVRHDVAMSGEVTLRGKILEVGGIKEKVLAAYRAGIRDVILPHGNDRDLRDVPEDVRARMRFDFVERMDDVLGIALLTPPGAKEIDIGPASPPPLPEEQQPRARRVARGRDSGDAP